LNDPFTLELEVACPYCLGKAECVPSQKIYGKHSKPYGMFWLCPPCKAYVSCHTGTETPKGTLATKETRNLRSKAHSVFDPLWIKKATKQNISKSKARRAGYEWLGILLNVDQIDCHIAKLSDDQLNIVIVECEKYGT